ncbi:MAG: RNA methyltransferase, partial [Clostridiales bacterium]|nr:RNA methyltransferase [Clostridiales bacterium]
MMNVLTSRNNDNVKKAVKLRTDRDERTETGLFFIEGVRLCRDAVQSGIGVVSLFVTERAMGKYETEIKEISDAARESFLITEEISEKLSDTKSPQGVFCICKTLDKNRNIDKINYNGIYAA